MKIWNNMTFLRQLLFIIITSFGISINLFSQKDNTPKYTFEFYIGGGYDRGPNGIIAERLNENYLTDIGLVDIYGMNSLTINRIWSYNGLSPTKTLFIGGNVNFEIKKNWSFYTGIRVHLRRIVITNTITNNISTVSSIDTLVSSDRDFNCVRTIARFASAQGLLGMGNEQFNTHKQYHIQIPLGLKLALPNHRIKYRLGTYIGIPINNRSARQRTIFSQIASSIDCNEDLSTFYDNRDQNHGSWLIGIQGGIQYYFTKHWGLDLGIDQVLTDLLKKHPTSPTYIGIHRYNYRPFTVQARITYQILN